MRVGDNNFENVEEIKGTLSADLAKIIEAPLPAQIKLNILKTLESDIHNSLSIVEKNNPMCPRCKERYRRNSYEFCQKKNSIIAICPKSYQIPLKEVIDDKKVLTQKEIDELIQILNGLDYGYAN